MIKSLTAAAAVAAALLAGAPAPQAEAKTSVNITIGIGDCGYYNGCYIGQRHRHRQHYYVPDEVSCRTGARIVARNGYWDVDAIDCSRPGYKFLAWRHDRQYLVKVNSYGTITSVRRAY